MINLQHFFSTCVDFTKTYPNGNHRYESLQSFAVLESWTDINTDSLGKELADRGKPYFYSKLWERSNYNPSMLKTDLGPVFVIIDNGEFITEPFGKQQRYNSLDLAFIEPYIKICSCNNKCNCDQRVLGQLYANMVIKANQFIQYLNGLVFIETGFKHTTLLQPVDVKDEVLTRQFKTSLNNLNNQITLIPWAGGKDDYHGYYFSLNVPVLECVTYTPVNHQDKPIGPDNGCK